MVAQQKIYRVLKLIALLKQRPRSVTYLAQVLESTTRTVYRYFELLESVGFQVDKDWHNHYFIQDWEDKANKIAFSPEEASLINKLIKSGAQKHPLRDSVMAKLYVHSELKTISEGLIKARLGKLVEQIATAIKDQRQIILKNYHSASSGEIRDRLVEPININPDYNSFSAYDPKDRLSKTFKLERTSEVIILDKPFQHAHYHQQQKADMFGMSGGKKYTVSLKLSLRAYLLLREEFPLSIPYTKKEADDYLFDGPVQGFQGIGRFVLGLMDDIEILKPTAFRRYCTEVIANRKL